MKPEIMERFGRIEDLDRAFDLEYWQKQSEAARFNAAWELVEFAWHLKKRDPNELRLQRGVESFGRNSS